MLRPFLFPFAVFVLFSRLHVCVLLTATIAPKNHNATGPNELYNLINVAYGGMCVINDPGCYLCISSMNPAAGCAVCAEGYKRVLPSLSTKWSMGRRAILGSKNNQAPSVPYCLGSSITAKLGNDVLANAGELKAAINATAADSKNALFVLGNGANTARAGVRASVQDLLRDPLRTVEERQAAISSLAMELSAEEEY